MKCKNCGAELPEGTLICSRCGVRQSTSETIKKNNNKKESAKSISAVVGCVVVVAVLFVLGLTVKTTGIMSDGVGGVVENIKNVFSGNSTYMSSGGGSGWGGNDGSKNSGNGDGANNFTNEGINNQRNEKKKLTYYETKPENFVYDSETEIAYANNELRISKEGIVCEPYNKAKNGIATNYDWSGCTLKDYLNQDL